MKKLVKRAVSRAAAGQLADLRGDVARLQRDVEECRRLNERLSDVLDVVVELLLPEQDRNDERLTEALRRL